VHSAIINAAVLCFSTKSQHTYTNIIPFLKPNVNGHGKYNWQGYFSEFYAKFIKIACFSVYHSKIEKISARGNTALETFSED